MISLYKLLLSKKSVPFNLKTSLETIPIVLGKNTEEFFKNPFRAYMDNVLEKEDNLKRVNLDKYVQGKGGEASEYVIEMSKNIDALPKNIDARSLGEEYCLVRKESRTRNERIGSAIIEVKHAYKDAIDIANLLHSALLSLQAESSHMPSAVTLTENEAKYALNNAMDNVSFLRETLLSLQTLKRKEG